MNNLYQNGGRNGGRDDRRSGAGDVFFNAEPEEWSRRRSKKRKTRTSNTESQSKIDIEQFKTLNTDDKLSALFTKFNSNTEFLSSNNNNNNNNNIRFISPSNDEHYTWGKENTHKKKNVSVV